MNVIRSKLSSKGRTTIPLRVRRALKLAAGDAIAYSIEGDRVVLSNAEAMAAGDPFAVFNEWSSEADLRAYAGL